MDGGEGTHDARYSCLLLPEYSQKTGNTKGISNTEQTMLDISDPLYNSIMSFYNHLYHRYELHYAINEGVKISLLNLIAEDFQFKELKATGRKGLSIESTFRCMLLKQITGDSYEKLAFHLQKLCNLVSQEFPAISGFLQKCLFMDGH
jgi:hypothetical protein